MTKVKIKTVHDQVRFLDEYYQWRMKIFTRDSFTCRKCKVPGRMKSSTERGKPILHIDHFPKSFLQIMKKFKITNIEEAVNCQELWNVDNGRVLCERCHYKTKSYGKH